MSKGFEVKARPMDSAPKDGQMLRLLVQFDDHATEDSIGPAWTIGANAFDDTGEDDWQFAGWCWSHDHFTAGVGTPVGWLPMHDEDSRQLAEQRAELLEALVEARQELRAIAIERGDEPYNNLKVNSAIDRARPTQQRNATGGEG